MTIYANQSCFHVAVNMTSIILRAIWNHRSEVHVEPSPPGYAPVATKR